jgi:hypothetical protein
MPDARRRSRTKGSHVRPGRGGLARWPGVGELWPLAWRQGTDAMMTSFGTSQRYAILLPTRTDAEPDPVATASHTTTTSRVNPDTGND